MGLIGGTSKAGLPGRTDSQVRRDLRLSTTDAMLFSVMVGCGEAYFVAFALAVGMGELRAGLLSSVPLLAGALLQLASPWAVRKLGSHKRWVVLTAGLQAISFVPLAVAAFLGQMPAWLLFVCVGLYWAFNLGSAPAWNTWIGTVVPTAVRAKYFASRTRAAQAVMLVSLIGAGLILHFGRHGDSYSWVYGALFIIAGLSRLGSTWCHTRISEPVPMPPGQRTVPFRNFLRGPKAVSGGRLLLYMLALQVCVQVSGPFFGPYMLEDRQFDYPTFAMLLCCSYIGRVLAMPLIGRYAKRYGAGNLLWIGGLGILPLSAIWVISPSPWFLIWVQLLSGVMWACYEMATMLLLLETIPANERTSVLTTQNCLNAIMIVVGAACGALIFHAMGQDTQAYHTLFIVSAVLRLGTVILLFRVHKPAIKNITPIIFRTVGIRPQFGGIDRPLLASIEDENTEKVSTSAGVADEPGR
ncbi:MFS transporter [Nodularia spumigena]|uniref:MFS transporter n=1 Tax=Nodularia spumigena TaxID=70799 RepID=UPI002B1F1854|nr:MFS transporter [Nodularia spumigena]MEA5614541.1 MFS transporter [Nodularia spumigena UHCC 0040]